MRDIKKENFDSDKILRDIRTFYESEEGYYEPVRTNNALNSNYIEYESNGDEDKISSIKGYLDMTRQYLSDIINNHTTQDEWEIQLTLSINYASSKDFKEIRTIHSNSDNVEIMIGYKTYEVIEELFESLLKKYQEGLEAKMGGSGFIFDGVDLLYYKLHKVTLNRVGSYIDSPE